MIRVTCMILLSFLTLVTAAAWYMQVSGKHGVVLNITPGSRIVFAGQYDTVYLAFRWGPFLKRDEVPTERRFGIPGLPISLRQERVRDSLRTYGWAVRLHLWLATGLVGIGWIAYPFVSRRLLRRLRRKRCLCITCGCDLRGTPERCPECGEEHR